MTYDEYDKLPGLRASVLKHGATSMAHMHAAATGKLAGTSKALRWGRLFHSAILEHDTWLRMVSVWNGERKVGAAWKEFCEESMQRGGPDWIVDTEEFDELMAMSTAVATCREAAFLIARTAHEVSYSWEIPLVGQCKCRLDGVSDEIGIVELKTTAKPTPREFANQFAALGYDIQLGWQKLAAQSAGVRVNSVHMITVESRPPYCVAVYHIPDSVVDKGAERAIKLARDYRVCETIGQWPGPTTGIQEFQLPAWATGEGAAVPTESMEAGEL